MKLVQRLPRDKSNNGQICSKCFHAVSNHNVEIDTKKPKQSAKLHSCNVCECKECAW